MVILKQAILLGQLRSRLLHKKFKLTIDTVLHGSSSMKGNKATRTACKRKQYNLILIYAAKSK